MALRTYGRVVDPVSGSKFWVQVDPDVNGFNDPVYLTALIQCCKLNWGESPFFGDWGIPAHPSVVTQVFPDYHMALMQQRFAPYFLALGMSKRAVETPTYDISIIFHTGAQISTTVVPQAAVDAYGQAIVDVHGYSTAVGTKTGRFAPV